MALNKAKRKQIVKAASEAFAEAGYARASMEQVAQQAGVSKATLYSHFSSKKALFQTAVSVSTQLFLEEIDLEALLDVDLREALLTLGMHYHAYMFDEKIVRFLRALIGEIGQFPDIGQQFFEAGPMEARNAVMHLLKRHPQLSSRITLHDLNEMAALYMTLIKGDYQIRALLGQDISPQVLNKHLLKAVDQFITLISAG